MSIFVVRAHWDADATVWWAESDDVPGLVAESASHDGLVAELRLLVPDLVAMNMPGYRDQGIDVQLVSDQVEHLHAA